MKAYVRSTWRLLYDIRGNSTKTWAPNLRTDLTIVWLIYVAVGLTQATILYKYIHSQLFAWQLSKLSQYLLHSNRSSVYRSLFSSSKFIRFTKVIRDSIQWFNLFSFLFGLKCVHMCGFSHQKRKKAFSYTFVQFFFFSLFLLKAFSLLFLATFKLYFFLQYNCQSEVTHALHYP